MDQQVQVTIEDGPDRSQVAAVTASSLSKGTVSFSDVWAALVAPSPHSASVDRTPPKPVPLTQEQREALVRLPDVYGVAAPDTDRALTEREQQALVEESQVISTILSMLEKRKREGLREAVATHLDHVLDEALDEQERASLRVDAKGHYQVRQDVPVPGTGMKMQKTVSEPKPVLSMEKVQRAHDDGLISREVYLSITSKPEVPRVLDEAKMVKAIKADPDLLWVLSEYTTSASPVTTVKVTKDA